MTYRECFDHVLCVNMILNTNQMAQQDDVYDCIQTGHDLQVGVFHRQC